MKKTIDKLGRIVIPSELRKELGISDGDEMKLEVKDGKLVVSKAHKKDSPEERIKELERQIRIKDAWCKLIHDIGFDYDGYRDAQNLMDLIDELVRYSQKAIACEETMVYCLTDENGNVIEENIIYEMVK